MKIISTKHFPEKIFALGIVTIFISNIFGFLLIILSFLILKKEKWVMIFGKIIFFLFFILALLFSLFETRVFWGGIGLLLVSLYYLLSFYDFSKTTKRNN